jgi:hypothetical protein
MGESGNSQAYDEGSIPFTRSRIAVRATVSGSAPVAGATKGVL